MVGVELLVGGWFTSAVIGGVVEKARDYFKANYELQKDTQEMVEELTDALLLCQATVTEAEKRTIINNPALANLLRRLRQAAYDAEDVLDNMEAQSIKVEVQGKNKVRKIASSSLSVVGNTIYPDNNLKSLKEIVDKMKKLSTQIPTIHNLVNMNINIESFTREVGNPRETISQPLDDVGLYGRENELNLILDTILRSESESSKKGEQNYRGILVIPIVGMGGVGKTALAQAVYNNPDVQQTFAKRAVYNNREVQQTFAKRAWISVSNKPDVVLVMRKIIQSLGGSIRLDVVTLEEISKKLSAIIGGVKFLIVLDDMFESQWDFIQKILSRGAPGSVVLITTQNHVFANRVGTFGPIALTALDSGIFWKLFEHFALGNEVMSEEKSIILKSIGRKIADKLHGLPLAAKIIGKILRSKLDEDKWRIISESEWWNIPEGKSQILPSIGLGYEHLNPCLRQCFAYCSLFPRNSLIEKDRLVHMWIAQNFIQSDVNGVMRLEDIGRQWFDELVEKSFFQRAGDSNNYVMHELMHDLAVIVSSGECFFLREGVDKIPLGVRHLAVDTNNLEVIKGIQKHKNLRSFLYFGCCQVEGMYKAINDTLSNLDSIRVLDLSYMRMENEREPPRTIWNLQHLRFLDLSSTGIKSLTRSSINLYHLQALYIKKCRFLELPRGINKLINLRHLWADEETIAPISGIGQLTNLQELGIFVVGKNEGHRITELRNLREIGGTLRIKNFENIKNKDEAMLANLVDKKHLDSIYIYSSTKSRESNVDVEVLEGLQPHKDIKDLRIDNYFGSVFPNWIIQIGDFLNLKTLYLNYCVNVKVLPPLGELPSLKYLHMEELRSVKFINYHLYGKKQTVFPLLEELVLKTLYDCEGWTGDARAREKIFPRLSKLTIEQNNTLRVAPIDSFSSSLKELIISECISLREAPIDSFSSSLKELIISGCNKLISIGNSVPCLCSLTLLKLCSSPVSVTIDLLNMPLLENLDLDRCSELIINGDLQSLTHLKRLRLVNCSKLFSKYSTKDHQKGKGLQVHRDEGLRSLTHIEADHSLLNHEYHLILGSLPSLPVLKLSDITRFTKDQILWFQELTALKEIHFSHCEFEHLPASLTQLSSLKKLGLCGCRELKSLSDSMPPNLQELTLLKCSPNLVQLCEANKGQDQQFTSSIPVIHIDDTTPHHKRQIPLSTRISIEIRKPSSDAIGIQACASCGKIFELSDFRLHDIKLGWI
jgi:broad-specificity NMP kinase